jgi:hypothetical protein
MVRPSVFFCALRLGGYPSLALTDSQPRGRRRDMSMTIDKQYEHLGQTQGVADHDHDLIHELSRRLDCLWRYDQYIANADGQPELREFWLSVKSQEQTNIDRLKSLITQHVQSHCF